MPFLIQIDTPYAVIALTVIVGLFGWLFRQVIALGKDMVAVQSALKYYFETTGKGAAIVLDSPNPTPPEMSELLKKHREGTLTLEEKGILTAWLRQVIADPHEAGKRGAALSLLGAIGATERLDAR